MHVNPLILVYRAPMNQWGDQVGESVMRRLTQRYVQGRLARSEVVRGTAYRQRSVLASFAASYGDRPVRNLSQADIERWIESRAHLAPGTRRYDIATLRQFVKWLQMNRHITRDPMIAIKNPRLPRHVPRALSKVETRAICAVLPDTRAHAIYVLMRRLGLRRCEVLSVEVGDWDRTKNVLRIVGKGSHEREVPVTEHAARRLADYLAEHPATAGPLIRRYDTNGPISNSYLGKLMRSWMEEAGVKQAPHDGRACHSLRHTIASEVADVEPDLRVVQELLGHASLSSTQIYLRRARLSKIREAMERTAS